MVGNCKGIINMNEKLELGGGQLMLGNLILNC